MKYRETRPIDDAQRSKIRRISKYDERLWFMFDLFSPTKLKPTSDGVIKSSKIMVEKLIDKNYEGAALLSKR